MRNDKTRTPSGRGLTKNEADFPSGKWDLFPNVENGALSLNTKNGALSLNAEIRVYP
jgi:hypothetical protein